MERTRHHSVRLTTGQAFDVVSMWRAERNLNAKYRNWANTLILFCIRWFCITRKHSQRTCNRNHCSLEALTKQPSKLFLLNGVDAFGPIWILNFNDSDLFKLAIGM